jgi:hypothetical protein
MTNYTRFDIVIGDWTPSIYLSYVRQIARQIRRQIRQTAHLNSKIL